MSSERFSFSIVRLLVVVAIFAGEFELNRRLGAVGITLAVITGTTLSLLVFLVRKQDFPRIIGLLICSAIGAAVGLDFSPAIRPPGEPGDEIRYILGGIAASWFVWFLATNPPVTRNTPTGIEDSQHFDSRTDR